MEFGFSRAALPDKPQPSGEVAEKLAVNVRLDPLVRALTPAMQPIFDVATATRRNAIEALTPTQRKLFDALTDEYQLAPQLAAAAGLPDPTDANGNARRELNNLCRMGLAEGVLTAVQNGGAGRPNLVALGK